VTVRSETGRGCLFDLALRAAFLYYLIANLVGIGRVLGAVDRPFGGFVWLFDDSEGHLVGFESGEDWPGRAAGLMFDDRIVRIAGREIPINGKPDVIADVYASTPVGTLVEYEVVRPGTSGTLRFRIPVSRFTLAYAAEAYLPFALAAFALWGMGFFVHFVGPRDEVATIFALFCLALSGPFGYHLFNGFIHEHYVANWALYTMYAPVWPLFNAIAVHLFARFPMRHRWWDKAGVWVYAVAAVIGLGYTLTFVPGASRAPRQALLLLTALGSVAGSVFWAASLWLAFRRSPSVQVRKQVVISGLGFGLGIVAPFLLAAAYILFRPYPEVWWSPGVLFGERTVADWLVPLPIQLLVIATVFPGFLGVAILRYRVFSAKPALVKALAGALLASALVIAYTASFFGFRSLFAMLQLDSVLARILEVRLDPFWMSSVLATMISAVLFGPLRDRVLVLATRLLYPYRISPAEAVRRLMETVRDGGDGSADATPWRLAAVVARALERLLHVEVVSVWFFSDVRSELTRVDLAEPDAEPLRLHREQAARLVEAQVPADDLARYGDLGDVGQRLTLLGTALCLPLVYARRELVGLVGVGQRKDGVEFGPEDREVLAHLAGYLLLLLKNERTILELQHSRERAAQAEEMERRRLAGELHDLTLQQLGYLATVQLELCSRALVDPERAQGVIREAQATARQAAADLRQVLADLSPDVVSRRGLVSAVESFLNAERGRAHSAGAAIHLELCGCVDRLVSQERELAVFRCIQESVRNALKHAQAHTVKVELRCTAGELVASITDDGVGFDLEAAGEALRQGHLGLAAMRDRIEAVGGKLAVGSRPGSGTTLRATVPREQGRP
jgi:signal transduction histidine kinase